MCPSLHLAVLVPAKGIQTACFARIPGHLSTIIEVVNMVRHRAVKVAAPPESLAECHFHCDVRPCARPSSITLSSRRHALVAIQAFAITRNVLYGNYNDSHVAAVKGVDEPAPVIANNVGLTVT